jgi:hypothetical protein
MRQRDSRWLAIGLGAWLLWPATAAGIEWELRLDTGADLYQPVNVAGQTFTRVPYLAAFAFDTTGVPALGTAGFHGMFRYRTDFAGPDTLGYLSEDRFEFLYAYIDWQDPKRWVELRLGRQYLYDLHRFESVDAARLRVRLPIPLAIEALVGSPVTGFDPLRGRGADLFPSFANSADGRAYGGSDYGVLVQAALALVDHTNTRFRLVFRHQQSTNIWQQGLGVALGQTVGAFGVHGDVSVDTLAGRVSGADAGLSYRPDEGTALHLGYQLVAPQFGPNSIFWAFDFQPYHAWTLRGHLPVGRLRLGGSARLSWLTARKTDREGEDLAEDVRADRLASDLSLKVLLGDPEQHEGALAVVYQDGHGGRRLGPGVEGSFRIQDWLRLEAGLDALHAVDELQPTQRGWVSAFHLAARARLWDYGYLRLGLSNYTTPFTPLQLRGRFEAGARLGGPRARWRP